jgi:iron complex outermembrane receptor protein
MGAGCGDDESRRCNAGWQQRLRRGNHRHRSAQGAGGCNLHQEERRHDRRLGVADEAGKLPDNSITEVLQRVSGVSISRFAGANGGSTAFQIEGTGITVRGLPFNSSMLNGQQLFSANGASAISWNEVTPELMAGVDVYKTTRADIIEGGASAIDLRTHLPFDFKDTQFNVTAGGSYGTQVKKASPRISALFSKRFDTGIGEIGVLWDLAYSRLYQQSSNLQVGAMFAEYAPTSKRDDHLAFVPSSFNWNNNQNRRDRYGAYQALQWRPASNLTLTNTIFFSQYVENSQGTSGAVGGIPSASTTVMPVVGSPVEYDANGAFRKGSLTFASTGKCGGVYEHDHRHQLAARLVPDRLRCFLRRSRIVDSVGLVG